MPFTVCYYHVVWATKNRQPWLSQDVEEIVFESIRETSTRLKCPIHALNAHVNHVHVAVNIGTHLAVREWIGRVKGVASRQVNKQCPELNGAFRWQKSYGVLTFGAKALPLVAAYIERQKEHHSAGTLESYMENMGEDE